MSFSVTPEEVIARLPETGRPLSTEQINLLIGDAIMAIKLAFWHRGKTFGDEVASDPMLGEAAKLVIFELVAKHVATVGRKGLRSVSSATGAISDRWEFIEQQQSGWATVLLSNDLLDMLRLRGAYSRGCFPATPPWPERGHL